jgi:hypothetical protein
MVSAVLSDAAVEEVLDFLTGAVRAYRSAERTVTLGYRA